jgi:hypothetical protein
MSFAKLLHISIAIHRPYLCMILMASTFQIPIIQVGLFLIIIPHCLWTTSSRAFWPDLSTAIPLLYIQFLNICQIGSVNLTHFPPSALWPLIRSIHLHLAIRSIPHIGHTVVPLLLLLLLLLLANSFPMVCPRVSAQIMCQPTNA